MNIKVVFYFYVAWIILIPPIESLASFKMKPEFYITDEEKCIIELLRSLYDKNNMSPQDILSKNMSSKCSIIRSATIKSLLHDNPGGMRLAIIKKGLMDPDEEIRAHSALIVDLLATARELKEYSKNSDVTGILLEMLDNPSARIVVSAVNALDGLEYRGALPRIIKLLEHDSADVREWSLEYIQHNDDKKEAEEAVIKCLKDKDSRVQRTAIIALNNYPSLRVENELHSVMDASQDVLVMIEAALTLFYLSDDPKPEYIYQRFLNFDYKSKSEACTVVSMLSGQPQTETSKMLWDRISKLYGKCN
ncbi:MAG: HEAT repeat domain-containing protein [Nitrospinota bacterium]|nr:HEAT repeat domain-containing protein [Nitrospinota bacterium]